MSFSGLRILMTYMVRERINKEEKNWALSCSQRTRWMARVYRAYLRLCVAIEERSIKYAVVQILNHLYSITVILKDERRDNYMTHCFHQFVEVLRKARTLTIVEANNSSIIKRKEGENITLTCSINGAHADTLVYWSVRGTILKTNMSTYLTYQFVAKPSDHLKQFVCNANSSEDSYVLKAKIQLSLILKPNVTVVSHPSPPTVRKGHNITLLCQDKSGNGEMINNFVWNQPGRLLNTNTSTLQIVRAQSDVTGEYICLVKNVAGEDIDVVNVTVIYPPVVQNYNMTFTINDRPIALKCEANGAPNKYKFSEWRHYTHNDQLVRTLQGYTNGTLILPHHEDITFEESGIYICNVTNEVQDEDGHVWKVGKVEVTFKVDLNESPSTSASMSAGRTDVYSSIDRRRENSNKHKVTYKISEPEQSGSSNLNYIDVVFEPQAHSGKLYIHGADSRTPYADIDFSAKAEPLISSDEDDESSVNEKENCDKCVSSEDVQQWNIIED
ncbi:Hypothetical predicted protein [Mytilus galloprovincialis]|uniref:Ig-like domain-containing protein n=1 Tax=Mytilus galloprovincialis TaxID=29158 RepID=A0A8B6EER4_MYTGA|nr:Hypothetical predicted protein [Mytilus galloprovincialis]